MRETTCRGQPGADPTCLPCSITAQQLERLIEKNYYLNRSAKEGYRAYLQAYASHSLKHVFNVNELDLQKVAKSFGFTVPPSVNLSTIRPARRATRWGGVVANGASPRATIVVVPPAPDIASSGKGEKIQRRGGGGGFGAGYKQKPEAANAAKNIIYKRPNLAKPGADGRQWSR